MEQIHAQIYSLINGLRSAKSIGILLPNDERVLNESIIFDELKPILPISVKFQIWKSFRDLMQINLVDAQLFSCKFSTSIRNCCRQTVEMMLLYSNIAGHWSNGEWLYSNDTGLWLKFLHILFIHLSKVIVNLVWLRIITNATNFGYVNNFVFFQSHSNDKFYSQIDSTISLGRTWANKLLCKQRVFTIQQKKCICLFLCEIIAEENRFHGISTLIDSAFAKRIYLLFSSRPSRVQAPLSNKHRM